MRLIGVAIVVLGTIVGLYYMGWLNPEAEQKVEKGMEAIEGTGILDKSIREISEGTVESIRNTLDTLSDSELKALLEKVENEELELDHIDSEELKEMIQKKLDE